MKDILNKQIKEHVEKFTNFTITFCWKVNNIEYNITIVKKESSGSGSNQVSLDSFKKTVFIYKNNDNFEEFTLMFVSDTKKI